MKSRLSLWFLASLLVFLAACSGDIQPETTDESRVNRAVELYDLANDPEAQFVDQFQALTPDEVAVWIEGVHEADLAAYEALQETPYVERSVLKVSGLRTDDPALGSTPDEVAERIDAEGGVRYERVRLSEAELGAMRKEIEQTHALRQSYHETAVEAFGQSINTLSGAQWERIEQLQTLNAQDLETLQNCNFSEGTSQGSAPYVGRERLNRSVTYLGTVVDGNECDDLYRVSGTGSYDEIAQNPDSEFTCIARLAGLVVRPVERYRRIIYGGTIWYVLGARTRTNLFCGFRNQQTNFALSALAE